MSSDYLEATLVLLPSDAGGRDAAIEPRNGEYRPVLRGEDGSLVQLRLIEGPPRIAPGQHARVVAEIEAASCDTSRLDAGAELDLIEHEQVVGILTVARWWRGAVMA